MASWPTVDEIIRSMPPKPAPVAVEVDTPEPDANVLIVAQLEAIRQALEQVQLQTVVQSPEVVLSHDALTAMAETVAGLQPSADAEEIAEALAKRLHFPEPAEPQHIDLSVLGDLAETLKKLDFRMKGTSGGGSVGAILADNANRQVGKVSWDAAQHVIVDGTVSTSSPASENRLDYDVRTDSSPVYIGTADPGTLTSAPYWTVVKFSYDASNRATRKQTQTSIAWDSRTSGWGA